MDKKMIKDAKQGNRDMASKGKKIIHKKRMCNIINIIRTVILNMNYQKIYVNSLFNCKAVSCDRINLIL